PRRSGERPVVPRGLGGGRLRHAGGGLGRELRPLAGRLRLVLPGGTTTRRGAAGPDRPPGRARLSCRAGRSPKVGVSGMGNPAGTLTRSWTSGPRDRTTRGFGDGTDDGIPPRDQRR